MRRRRPTLRRGIETIELAICLPVLLLVTFAGFEYGWLVLRSMQIDQAARAGARYAAMSGSNAESIHDRVAQALQRSGIASATVIVDPADPSSVEAGTSITITVDVDYSEVKLLGLGGIMPLPAALHGRASMVREPDS
jgi:Flp pilus assembly protein TadG